MKNENDHARVDGQPLADHGDLPRQATGPSDIAEAVREDLAQLAHDWEPTVVMNIEFHPSTTIVIVLRQLAEEAYRRGRSTALQSYQQQCVQAVEALQPVVMDIGWNDRPAESAEWLKRSDVLAALHASVPPTEQ